MAIIVNVHGGNGEQAIRNLKRKMQRERIFYSMKKKRAYEKPSEARVRKNQETARRIRKLEWKKRVMDAG